MIQFVDRARSASCRSEEHMFFLSKERHSEVFILCEGIDWSCRLLDCDRAFSDCSFSCCIQKLASSSSNFSITGWVSHLAKRRNTMESEENHCEERKEETHRQQQQHRKTKNQTAPYWSIKLIGYESYQLFRVPHCQSISFEIGIRRRIHSCEMQE